MGHTIKLELPDRLYDALQQQAKQSGKELEDFMVDRLTERTESPEDDALLRLAGVLDSEVPDLADRHDEYLADGLAQRLNPRAGS